MIKICEETCGLRVLGETKQRRASPMSNIVKQMSSSLEEDDMMYGVPEVTTLQAVHAVAYTRPATIFSEFFAYHQRIAFSICATNLAVICNKQMHCFERLSSVAELLAFCLPIFSLAVIINFLRSAALQQNIPVLFVLSAISCFCNVVGSIMGCTLTLSTWLCDPDPCGTLGHHLCSCFNCIEFASSSSGTTQT
jgi:hypothetical protein